MSIYATALAHYKRANWKEAVTALDKLPLKKFKEKEWVLHGSAMSELHDTAAAIESFKNALRANQKSVHAMQNLARLYQESGDFDRARKIYGNMPTKAYENLTTYMNKGEFYKLVGEFDSALECFNKSISKVARPENSLSPRNAAQTIMRLLVLCYLTNDYKALLRIMRLLSSDTIKQNTDRAAAAYIQLVLKLTNENGYLQSEEVDSCENYIFAIGESHILPLHNQIVELKGIKYKIQSKWIEGLKAFHFGNPLENTYKQSLISIAESLPEAAKVILVAGEIDTRIDSGIIPASAKMNKSAENVASDTAADYVSFIQRTLTTNDVLFWGVPKLPESSAGQKAEYQVTESIIKSFNERLKQRACSNGYLFCDTYAASNELGTNAYWDRRHLKGETIRRVFDKYLVSPDKSSD